VRRGIEGLAVDVDLALEWDAIDFDLGRAAGRVEGAFPV
jgi:hypothetical protein